MSFGSPWHYALWNNLSVDSLKGHLLGRFGKAVEVTLFRADSVEAVNAVIDELAVNRWDIVGLSVELGTLVLVDEFIDRYALTTFGRRPMLVFGNQVPTYFPERFLNDKRLPSVFVCLHEGELTIEGLVEHLRGKKELEEVPNLIFRRSFGEVPVRTQLRALDPVELIHAPTVDTAKPGITNMVQASRGCIFSCNFCTRHLNWDAGAKLAVGNSGPSADENVNWRPLPLGRVFENIERLVAKGITEIEFCDDEFFGGRSEARLARVEEIARGIRQIGLRSGTQLRFRLFTTPLIVARDPASDHIRRQNERVRETFEMLIAAGLVRVYIGVDSGNVSQRERYHRTETLADIALAIKVLRELRLDIDIGFIMFDPHLTIDELLENANFFRRNNLVWHNTWPFRPLIVNEGTVVKSQLEVEGLLTGRQDPNFLSYEYRFKYDDVERVCSAVQALAQESAPIFYALKTISKSHWRGHETPETMFGQWACEQNALLYLSLMEDLAELTRAIASDRDLQRRVAVTRTQVASLVEEVRQRLAQGLFDCRAEDATTLQRHVASFDANSAAGLQPALRAAC